MRAGTGFNSRSGRAGDSLAACDASPDPVSSVVVPSPCPVPSAAGVFSSSTDSPVADKTSETVSPAKLNATPASVSDPELSGEASTGASVLTASPLLHANLIRHLLTVLLLLLMHVLDPQQAVVLHFPEDSILLDCLLRWHRVRRLLIRCLKLRQEKLQQKLNHCLFFLKLVVHQKHFLPALVRLLS